MIYLILFIFAMPNQPAWDTLVSHWLDVKSTDSKVFDPNVPVKHVFTVWPCSGSKDDCLVIRCKDPKDSLEVTSFHMNRMNYEDFARYARVYVPDPNRLPTPEPNEPTLAEVLEGITDPNLKEALKEMLK